MFLIRIQQVAINACAKLLKDVSQIDFKAIRF